VIPHRTSYCSYHVDALSLLPYLPQA
jgi:hypothetical protein